MIVDLLKPSGLNSQFDSKGSFANYVATMREKIERARQLLDENNRETIIDANSPFEWIPHSGKVKNGVLLIHGLFDSPYSMYSLAEYFRKQNYLVRAVLLPGHGTLPGDLLNISYHEWVKTTEFGVNSFVGEVENLFICGFSTGAALALHHVLYHPSPFIKGLLLFAPAIQLRRQFAVISNINNIMRHTVGGIRWYYTRDKNTDYAKYQSFTFNSAHQVYLLSRALRSRHKKFPLQTPVYVIATNNDEVLSIKGTVDFFTSTSHKLNQLLIYSNEPIITDDRRIDIKPSFFPEKNILNFSHVCLAIAPDHPHYGMESDYKDFLHYEQTLGRKYKNMRAEPDASVYLGAVNKENLIKYHLQRLTYNPDFYPLMTKIEKFIKKVI